MKFCKIATTLCIFLLHAAVMGQIDKVVVAYFSDWTLDILPASKVDYSKITHLNYAFALFTDQDYKPAIESGSVLQEVVTRAHQGKTKVLISIGGWTGSKYFSPMVASATNRALFIKNTVEFMNKYNLDGLDFDWEYPGREGLEGNIVSGQDTANYLTFLKELRTAIGTNKLLTAAVRVEPFDGPDGPVSSVAEFANIFDFINVMCYDLNGPWSTTTGPVGGLDFQKGKGEPFSIKQALKAWGSAGFPNNKMVVGVPFYGYAEGVNVDMTNTDQYATITNANLPSYAYHELFEKNVLSSPLEANAAAGWIRKFDPITQTPWVFNKNTKTYIAYDDTQSLKSKTEHVRCNGYRGAMLWSLDNDYNNQLLTALQNVFNTDSCNGTTLPPTSTVSSTSSAPSTSTSKPPPSSSTTSVASSSKPVTSSSAPVSSTSQSPQPTGSCTDGSYKCGGSKGPAFYQCVFGKWITQSCSGSSVCIQNGNTIYCGFP